MAYIKRLVMHGFKSFPKKTEVPFTSGINVVLGPNGSGKSNVSDALCFVLGRLSAKSMRAAKSKNLIFMGTKAASPSKEASVEMVFDNEDNTFSLPEKEITIKRIVRRNGQSIYKINGHTQTRQEVLGLLAQAGIDPNGFNIILQGGIQNFVRMHTEERRKIIEEVSGIAVYESRKEKSLKELTRTEDKLKEVASILRERTTYLNNLEKERQEALRFQKLQQDAKKFKASIINFDLTKKNKHSEQINEEISKKNKEIEKIKKQNLNIETTVKNLEEKIIAINKKIQDSTGLEQEKLNQDIANIRAEIAGLNVKLENHESKLNSFVKQKQELEITIRDNTLSLRDLQKESPTIAKKEKDVQLKKQELEQLEEQRKKFYMVKSELRSIKDRFEDKKSLLQNYTNESDFIIKQINAISIELFDKNSSTEKLDELRVILAEKKEMLENINQREKHLEKNAFVSENEIEKQKKLMETISKMDICPLCKSNITENHIDHIHKETNPKIIALEKEIENSDKELVEIDSKRNLLKSTIEKITLEITRRDSDLIKLANIDDKKEQIKNLHEKITITKKELEELGKIKDNLEKNFDLNSNIEQKYETARIEVQEISIRSEENVNSEISFKQRELERSKIALKQLSREEEDIKEELTILKKQFADKDKLLEKQRKQEEELTQKFQKFIAERDACQMKIRENENELSSKKNSIYNLEQTINNFKIEKARVDAEIENLEMEILEFPDVELVKMNREALSERLARTTEALNRIGSVNMRSLEVYDEIKKEYDAINEKAESITKEKESILKIIP